MRIIFFISIYFLFGTTFCFANQPGKSFLFQIDSVEVKKSFQTQLFAGFNIGQLSWRDVELHVLYRFHLRHSIIAAGGYDFNGVDHGSKYDPDNVISGYGSGENTFELERFFYGKGCAGRLVYNFSYRINEPWTNMISVSVIAKSRSYSNYSFLPLSGRYGVCESGNQIIYGASILHSAIWSSKYFSVIYYGGFGFRHSENSIVWEREYNGYDFTHESRFNKIINIPSIDGGIIVLVKLRGY